MSEPWRIVVDRAGGPDAMRRESIALPDPGYGEVRIKTAASGVNFIDVYHRTGLYPVPLPTGIGGEASGVIDAVGEGVDRALAGRRVAVLTVTPGTYATHFLAPANRLVPLPETISDEIAAGALLKGLTVWMLVERIARAGPETTVLVHAAAGGVGSIAVQWLRALGATVIAHAGSAEKAARATALGAQHALHVPLGELAPAVRDLTDGRGVDVVFDSVGAASWAASLASTAKFGLMVSFGNASGAVPPVSLRDLLLAGSIFATRPSIADYAADPADLHKGAARLFALIENGDVRIDIGRRYKLAEAAEAHRALEARETTGSTILVP